MLSMRFKIICKLAADESFAAGNSKSERATTLKKKITQSKIQTQVHVFTSHEENLQNFERI